MYRVSPSQQGGSGWGADGLHIVIVQDDAIVGKSVNVWSWNLSRPMETYIIPTLWKQDYRFTAFCLKHTNLISEV